MDISIVLVEPARPGNVGAAARAMKTMGFTDLRIVGAPDIALEQEARAFAHGSTDILAAARPFRALSEALSDIDLAVATTGRRRGKRSDYYTPDQLRSMLVDEERGSAIALVFGREESGLSNEELSQCQIVSLVPMREPYPSLNLGQAVMVYTYALSSLQMSVAQPHHREADPASVHALVDKAQEVLPYLGFDPGRAVYHRMLERIGAAGRIDVHLMHSLLKAIEIHITNHR
ncbi:MAG: tRNA/rRNA methyltransferase [Alkalispirochaeta sp.]